MNRRHEDSKLDIGLVSQALDNSNKTGLYHPLAEFRSLLAILSGGAMAKTKTTKLELLQAKDVDGGSSKVLDPAAEALITANIKVTELTITLATVLAGETIEINGLIFTAHTDTTTVADREFSISGSDTEDAVELAICLNDPDYGVPGILATGAAAVLTLTSTVPGGVVITAASTDATFTVATTKAQSYVDIEGLVLDKDFTHIAVKVTTTATSNVAVVLIRYHSRKKITQKMGATYPA